jgi:mono/diheme cytochrome c family protein
MTRPALFVCLLVAALAAVSLAQDRDSYRPDHDGYTRIAVPFFEENCVRCHGPREENGNLRVDRLTPDDFASPLTMMRWGEVLNMVNSHQMPPAEERQPDPGDAGRFADWVLSQLAAGERARQTTDFVLRRLNRAEYDNTIRDLVGVSFRPAADFPEDGAASGFDNNGSALTVSPLHLELYYEAAKKILDGAIYTGRQPRSLTWRFDPEDNTLGLDRLRVDRDGQRIWLNPGNNKIENGWTIIHHDFWDTSLGFRGFTLPFEGEYVVRFRAYGHVPTRDDVIASIRELSNPSATELAHFRDDAMYDYGPPRVRIVQQINGQPRVLAEMDIPATESEPGIYEIRAPFTTENAGIQFYYAYDIPQVLENSSHQRKDAFARPELAIDWIEVEGPVFEQWPPESHARILPATLDRDEIAAAREVLARFMPRAYRRPVTAAEIDAKLELFAAIRDQKPSFEEAIKVPLTAVLTSPHFLFLVEPVVQGSRGNALNGYEIASRLSYFLWSSMPDDTLFSLASDGELLKPDVIRGQTDRMLADPRSHAFIENFVGQWLGLRDVGANPPVQNLFPEYDRHLEESIVRESEAFVAEILQHDLDIRNLIKSDFVTINERLARFYGIPGVRGDEFRRVPVPEGVQRGGLMTQASILTITSNGTRTSPVERGVWVLRTLLGDDPGLPVANVGEIAPSVPGIGKATVRERLEIHRSLPQCARCHNRIDPLGFALENFDASGAWRLQEGFGWNGRIGDDDPYIDASSALPDGTRIVGVDGLQQALLEREELFFTALTDRLMTYALGRTLGFGDQLTVRGIVAGLDDDNPTLRSLIHAITTSEQFRTR